MTATDPSPRAEKWPGFLGGVFVRAALVAFAVYFLWRVRMILATVLVSMVLAYAAAALVEPLCRRRIRGVSARTQRVLATIGVFLFLALIAFWSVRLAVQPFSAQFGLLNADWPAYEARMGDQLARVRGWYNDLPPDLQRFLEEQKARQSLPSPAEWLSGVIGTTVTWATHIVDLLLIPVLAFYFTLDSRPLRNEFVALVPRSRVRETLAFLREGSAIMRAYIVAQFWLALIAGVIVGVGLAVIGMPYALILGIFAGITRAIPVIGPLVGGIPIVLLAFLIGAQQGNPFLWGWVLLFFSLMHLLESKIIMPKFLGHRLHLHAAVIIIVLLIGGEFFGLMGMFLAAPIAAFLRVLIHHYVIRPSRRQPRFTFGIAGGERILRFDPAATQTARKDTPS